MNPITSRFAMATLAAIAAYGCTCVEPARAAEPFGTWLTEDGRARVRTEPCGSENSRLCGFIVWGSKPFDETGQPKVDKFNPDPKRQARPQLGHQMLLGLALNEDRHFEGKIYNADNGKSYDVTVWSEQPSTLTVMGCMLVFCASQKWKRVADIAPGQLRGATDASDGPKSDPEWAPKSGSQKNMPKGQSAISPH